MSILDAVLGSTEARRSAPPVIVSQQHDVNKIDVGGGGGGAKLPSDRLKDQIRSISSGGWDEAEYGVRREVQVAILTESLNKALEYEKSPEGIEAARIEAERVLIEMRERAIRRANLDVTNGKISVMVAGQAPWHKLGVNVEAAVSSKDARVLANIDWKVNKVPLNYTFGDKSMDAAGVFGIVRADTGAMLGCVGNFYQPIQNDEGFDFLDAVLEEFGAKYETAGAIAGGKKVWMQVKLPEQRFAVNGSDSIEPYAIFMNPHDGSGLALCVPTTERVVCANTYRVAHNGAASRGKGISIRHTGDIKRRIGEAQAALGLAVKGIKKFEEQAVAMAATTLPSEQRYFNAVLDAVLDVTEAEALKGADVLAAAIKVTDSGRELKEKEIQAQIDKRADLLADMLTRYDSEKCGTAGMRGTVWAGFNAVTEAADYGRRYIGTADARESRRFEAILTGDADDMKQAAMNVAMQYTRV